MTETLGLSRWPRAAVLSFTFIVAVVSGFFLLSLLQRNGAGAATVEEAVVPTSTESTEAVTPPVTEPDPTPAELTPPADPAPAPSTEAVDPVPGDGDAKTPVAEQPKAPAAPTTSQVVAPPAAHAAPVETAPAAEALGALAPAPADAPAPLTERARAQSPQAERNTTTIGAVLDRATPASGGSIGPEHSPAPIESPDRSAPLAPTPAPASSISAGELVQNLRTAGSTLLVAALFSAACLVLSRTWRLIVHDRHIALPVVLTAVARPG